MSIFNKLLQDINAIPNGFTEGIKDDLKSTFELLADFESDFINAKSKAREQALKAKASTITLQSINEDEDESNNTPENQRRQRKSSQATSSTNSLQSVKTAVLVDKSKRENEPKRVSKKRSKDEVEDMSSPEQDKRPKRNASVRAQSNISKQVNVNLTQKMRREEQPEKEVNPRSSRRRRGQSDKENDAPIIQVKQEKISMPAENSMDLDFVPVGIEVKKERDDIAMPPPAAPVPKPRGRQPRNKDKEQEKEKESETEKAEEAEEGPRRRTRKKITDVVPQVRSTRSTRASARASSRNTNQQSPNATDIEARPKRTRTKKKVSEPRQSEPEQETPVENSPVSPAEKPRPKRTRRGKAAEKQKSVETLKVPEIFSTNEERILEPIQNTSPILQKEKINVSTKEQKHDPKPVQQKISAQEKELTNKDMEKTIVIETSSLATNMNATIVLPNGIYQHNYLTPKNIHMNETVVIEARPRETVVLEQATAKMDATVVLEKAPSILTEDDSLLTNDESEDDKTPNTPPRNKAQTHAQPTSAVKEKVQKFEELASRVTRTKTRALAKQDDDTETHTPPDKVGQSVLSAETLNKMNSLIFNGKPATQISNSASKPRANIPTNMKSLQNSTSKITAINKLREDALAKEKEDARSKKEALLEARRELQRKKREEKMAAAAAAREQAERERRIALEIAQKGRDVKQQTADLGRLERVKEAERKKQELARKMAETEERRRAEEKARQQRLAEEQRRAEINRKKQMEEAENEKKEAAMMAREIEKRQREYQEKQKLRQRIEAEKMATPARALYAAMDPVYMADGFEFLNSDEEDDAKPTRPPPAWWSNKVRFQNLTKQANIKQCHIDRLFSVRIHSPDLREIFPQIDRRCLKRTSSAVWRTPDRPMPNIPEGDEIHYQHQVHKVHTLCTPSHTG